MQKKYSKKSLGNDTEQATLKHWVKETAVSHRWAGSKVGCETYTESSDYQGHVFKKVKLPPNHPSMKRTNSSPNVSDIKVTHQYHIGPTIQNNLFSWLTFFNSRKTLKIWQLRPVLRQFLVWLIFILECCASGCGTQNPLFPRGLYYTIITEHTVTFLLKLRSTQISRLLKEHSRSQNRI